MITLVTLLAFGIWVYLIGFHGRFWRSSPELEVGAPSGKASVAVVIPARDEAESIRQSVLSLLAQGYPGRLSIVVIDDNSSDGTGEIAASLATDGRVKVVGGQPLPAGWSGKLWAVHQGLLQKEAEDANFVLMTDADIEHAPDHVSMLVAKAEADRLDLVSEMVRLHCETVAERALIPAFVFFFQMLYPFSWAADPKRQLAGAAGGTMLVSRSAIDRIEGVSHIRHRLIDDCALAKEIKSTGGRIWLGHSDRAVSKRVYASWGEIWNMIARTAFVQLRYSLWMLLGCIAGMVLVYWAPPALAMFSRGISRVLGTLAWMLMAIAFQPTLRRYGRSPFWGLALPAISGFYLFATVNSAFRHFAGRGGGWKNRVYSKD